MSGGKNAGGGGPGASVAAASVMSSSLKLREIDLHIAEKYEVTKRLGKGAYGIVWKAKSRRSGRIVAVKKIFDAFRNRTDAQRTFREIVFLKEFRGHPNIIRLLNVHRADNDKDLYLVFEYMNTDLQRAIQRPGLLKEVHKRFIMYQLLSATQYLHSGNVIHRDQKPSNVLLDSECNCKIADFGLARSLVVRDPPQEGLEATLDNQEMGGNVNNNNNGVLTDYVATRWYRAPEILLGCKRYTKGVDLWSLGCILGEMLTGRPLFPGTSTLDQIEKIFSRLERGAFAKFRQNCPDISLHYNFCHGHPSDAHKDVRGPSRGASAPADAKGSQGAKKTIFESELGSVSSEAMQLVYELLRVVPGERITAEAALSHPYVSRFHNPKAKAHLFHKGDVVPPLSDDVQLSVDQYRSKLYDIIRQDKVARLIRHAGVKN